MNAVAPIVGESADLKTLLEQNPCVGPMKTGAKRFWTGAELKVLRAQYPAVSLAGCLSLLPGRSATSIYQQARKEGLVSPATKAGVPREKWTSSDAIDDVIRRVYQRAPTNDAVKKLSQTIGRPRWWVTKRATKLGLVPPRFKQPPWKEAEDEIVRANSHFSLRHIQRSLKRAGFTRSEAAIRVHIKRLGASMVDPDVYTARGLAELFGIDGKGVTVWIEKGWLRATHKDTGRGEATGARQWVIRQKDVRAFIIDNVAAIDLRKVDKFWFVELLTGRGA